MVGAVSRHCSYIDRAIDHFNGCVQKIKKMTNKIKTILTAGIIAGLLDITAAFLVYCGMMQLATPKAILLGIAAGIRGPVANSGGWLTAAAGLALHFFIAMIFAVIFVWLYPTFRKLIPNKWILGIIYGCLVWLIMNCLVVPLSALGRRPKWNFGFTHLPLAVLILIVSVGLPISLITAKMYRSNSRIL